MEYDLLIWVAAGVASLIAVSRLVIIPLAKTARSVKQKAAVVQQEQNEELNAKNMTKLAGGAAAGYVDNMLNNVEQGYMQAKAVYDAQLQACQKENMSPEQTEKILAPLRGKMRQAEFLLQNRESLREVNKIMTAPLIGKLAQKLIGGLL